MRNHRFVVGLSLVTFALLTISPTGQAGGLINNLPEDGSWVLFKIKSELDLSGNLQSFDREMKLSSVGKQEVDGMPGRWIEISTEISGRKVIGKLLIAEKYLKGDQNPFQHISKAFARGPDGEAVDFSDARLRQFMIFALAVPHFEKPEKKEKEKIKTELGEFECERQKGETELDGPMDVKVKMAGDIWTHDKVPFGLVKAKIKGDLGFGSVDTELEVTKSGKDAKSELPDAK